MSRIGKMPIAIPAGVEINININSIVVKGKLGTLTQAFDHNAVEVKVENNQILVQRFNDSKDARSKHGLYRALINNMVKGVSEGFKSVQELVGVGYRAVTQEQVLDLSLGQSHHIYFQIPAEVKVETISEKGKNPLVVLTTADKQLLGQISSKIRSLRKPEPYKGKGVRYQNEVVRRKAGKSAGKK
jgi:large subunit ribosomal protein L6